MRSIFTGTKKCAGAKHHKGRSPTGVLQKPTEGSAYNPVMRSRSVLHYFLYYFYIFFSNLIIAYALSEYSKSPIQFIVLLYPFLNQNLIPTQFFISTCKIIFVYPSCFQCSSYIFNIFLPNPFPCLLFFI